MPELKDIASWDESYIEALPCGEYDWIEYKGAEWFRIDAECLDQLSKYASAYANYDGGYLVVGVKERKGMPPTVDAGGVALSPTKDIKAWLEDKLPNLTDPTLPRIKIRIVEPTSPTSGISPGHGVIVVYIPASTSAPHQARDHKYYTRLGSKLAPLGTRAVMDMMQRIKHPNLLAEAFLNLKRPDDCSLLIRIHNESDVLARHVGVRIKCPVHFRKTLLSFPDSTIGDDAEGRNYWNVSFTNRGGAPLFPRSDISHTFPCRLGGRSDPPLKSSIPDMQVRIYADSMPFHEQTFELNSIINGCSDVMTSLLKKIE